MNSLNNKGKQSSISIILDFPMTIMHIMRQYLYMYIILNGC